MTKHYIGVDVSKDYLDIFVRPSDERMRYCRTVSGIESFIERLKSYEESVVIFEASGGYEKLLQSHLARHGIVYRVVNPCRAREFARACGRLAKTDDLDASMLALFGEKVDGYDVYQASAAEVLLKELLHRRRQLVEEMVREKNRLEKALHEVVKEDIKSHLKDLKARLCPIEQAMHELIQSIEELAKKAQIITSMVGVGPITATTLLTDLPELGLLNDKQIAALAGVAPMNYESGRLKGQRHIKGGRMFVRCTLYMATLTAIRHNLQLKTFYQHLREKGKPAKVAIVAAMRKLLIILNHMIRNGEKWNHKKFTLNP